MGAIQATLNNVSIVLPSLDPSDKFDRVVDGLIEAGFANIVIVDDGSREENRGHFRRAAEYPQCHILTHEVNRGKGEALKTAFAYLLENRPDCAGAVTIDGDGQHLIKDILRCVEAMTDDNTLVLGSRDFAAAEVPARSLSGNRAASLLLRLFRIRLSDTQTGLRCIPAALFPAMLQIKGSRFEYEMNMLLEMNRRHVALLEVPITAVYEDGNKESHYRPVRDTLKILWIVISFALATLFRFSLSSLICWAVDELLFLLVLTLVSGVSELVERLVATVISRACSSFLNFNLNRRLVFHGEDGYGKNLLRYYALAIPQMLVSWGLVHLAATLVGSESDILTTVIKCAVDVALYFISYRIQRAWVFKPREK